MDRLAFLGGKGGNGAGDNVAASGGQLDKPLEVSILPLELNLATILIIAVL